MWKVKTMVGKGENIKVAAKVELGIWNCTCQNSLSQEHKFWQAFMSTLSSKHPSDVGFEASETVKDVIF